LRAFGVAPSGWFAFVGLALLPARSLQASDAVTPRGSDPIRLPLRFIQSTPVTTITVEGHAVQAIVEISGGDADGALTLSKEAIENAHGLSLGTALANDALGHEFTRPRFKGLRFPMKSESTSSVSFL
jgi:hypothetical protein